ncbi:MAG: alpha-ribazole phosphatase [Syntrophotaleaceae bacterium]
MKTKTSNKPEQAETLSGGSEPGCTCYLIRHGDTRQDEVKRYIGHTDLPLNALGRDQARALKKRLAHIPFDRIYSSDLRRCLETARIIAGPQGKGIRKLPSLREINLGEWEGQPMASIRRRFPDQFENRGRDLARFRTPGGESFHELQARVVPAFLELINNTEGNLLVIAHAGVNRAILCHLLDRPLDELLELPQSYGCLNIIERQGDRLSVKSINQAENSFRI